jgi:hypothetical protein
MAMSQSRGVLYLQWGNQSPAFVQRSLASLRAMHPALPVHIHTLPSQSTLLNKPAMFELSPFEETLFLDADTIVLDHLDFGFEQAQRFGLACCICECPWARRFGGLSGELIEYNTGVLFFTRAAKPLFDAWKYWSAHLDSSIRFHDLAGQLQTMPVNDQGGFAKAIAETGFNPRVLPLNWNFRPTWQHSFFGPIKIWHDYSDPPADLYRLTAQQSGQQKVIDFYRLK